MGIPYSDVPQPIPGLVGRAGAGAGKILILRPSEDRRRRRGRPPRCPGAGSGPGPLRPRDRLASGVHDGLGSRWPRSRRARSPRFRRPVTRASRRGAVTCPAGNPGRDRRVEPRCSSGAPGAGATWRRWRSGPWRSPRSSGTSSACGAPCSTSTSPRSTIPIAPSSPTSSRPAGSRDGARASIAGCRSSARARRAICIRSNTCSIPGSRPGRRSTSTRSSRSG